jgi:hypothetical protein
MAKAEKAMNRQRPAKAAAAALAGETGCSEERKWRRNKLINIEVSMALNGNQ